MHRLLLLASLILAGCFEPDPDPTTHIIDPCQGLGIYLPPGCG